VIKMHTGITSKRKMEGLLISFVFFLIALIGDIIISDNILAKTFFILMLVLLIILFLYYRNKLNFENVQEKFEAPKYYKFKRSYFLIFVPYFVILNFIGIIIFAITNNLLIAIITYLVVGISSYFIYIKFVANSR